MAWTGIFVTADLPTATDPKISNRDCQLLPSWLNGRTLRLSNECQPLPTPERLMWIAWNLLPVIIETALQHGVFERLDQGARTAAQLAVETGASVRGLTGILNVLVGLELLGRDGDHYVLTPDKPHS